MRRILTLLTALALTATALAQPPPAKRLPPAGIAIATGDRAGLTAGAAALRAEIDALAALPASSRPAGAARYLPDVEIFHKAVDWALRYDEFFDPKQVSFARHLLEVGRERAAQLRAGQTPWLNAGGMVIRAYRSKVDGSVQPFAMVLPPGWKRDDGRPRRLDVVLSGRGEKRTELAFIAEHEKSPGQIVPDDTIILHPYGRYCNATKFAGEVDVFEAIDQVKAIYGVDAKRMVVRGFSMGGASTWHLAAHHPGFWCAASPGAGFSDTAVYTDAYAPGKEPITWWEQKLFRWYDATAYAGNLFNCPTIAYSGELDPAIRCANLMAKMMAAEDLKLEHLIGPQTAHKYHPETKDQLAARLATLAAKGRSDRPTEVRLTTYTLRYPAASWVQIEGLEKHWERADVRARLEQPDALAVTTKNVTALQFLLQSDWTGNVAIDGQSVAIAGEAKPAGLWLRKQGARWVRGAPTAALRKRPGLTGPIDDAFMHAFLFVRPTGRPFNATSGRWVEGEIAHARKMWRDIFRGDAPVRDDSAVSAADIAGHNLVLWGDPASNAILARLLAQLPLTWNEKEIVFRGRTYDAAHHAPILIFPNPLNPQRYVVLNSGIDFRDHAYGSNSLQIAKLPDFALVDLREAPGPRWPGKIVDAGFFDEEWK
jgi:hypothetical protein